MARSLLGLPRRGLWLLLVYPLLMATACQDTSYGPLLQELCLSQFQVSMDAIGKTLWCDWGKTIRSYSELTDCTRNVAAQLNCFWPNAAVDTFFVAIHQHYFKNCPVSGRAVRDPPRNILCPFIVVPILVTLLVTALVVWRSKRPEGIV
ncbi:receptor activity-modifying protein 1 isoform X1 [Mustela lutreola]|uniref:Receptor activity-modifying protein 1 n=2 Tax=Mustela putorius furo TaxID=9669 RepID=M3XLZ5_MUSPF|nr:receptor activity-modifying protein 1 isoform X1 [Mustela putorius furo]XP_059023554.1 receptor activity-modifying protein 1 isoform X1 [Mustela lutreola]